MPSPSDPPKVQSPPPVALYVAPLQGVQAHHNPADSLVKGKAYLVKADLSLLHMYHLEGQQCTWSKSMFEVRYEVWLN